MTKNKTRLQGSKICFDIDNSGYIGQQPQLGLEFRKVCLIQCLFQILLLVPLLSKLLKIALSNRL